jgi:ADP-ribose pyrophosphatase
MKEKEIIPEQIISEKIVYKSTAFNVCERNVKLNNGKDFSRSIILEDDAVIIIPLFEDQSIRLIHEYRAASQQWMIQLPAGGVKLNETQSIAAHRELAEEAGLFTGKLEKIGGYYSSPGTTTEFLHIFLATELENTKKGKLDIDEHIEHITWDYSRCIKGIRNQEITDSKTIATILYAGLHCDLLKLKKQKITWK